jgi:hypothetical protein
MQDYLEEAVMSCTRGMILYQVSAITTLQMMFRTTVLGEKMILVFQMIHVSFQVRTAFFGGRNCVDYIVLDIYNWAATANLPIGTIFTSVHR